jgi:DNA repair protein RadC
VFDGNKNSINHSHHDNADHTHYPQCHRGRTHLQNESKPSERFEIESSTSVFNLVKELYNEETVELREEFKVIFLNRANKVLGYFNVSQGGVAGTVADPKLIFVSALKALATGIILVHNHPSGNLKPSQQDIDLTKKIKEGGRLLDISVLDHVIYTVEGYYSFADEGIV